MTQQQLPPVIWRHNPGSKYCVTLVLEGVERPWEISKGIPRAHDFPSGAQFTMDKQFKKQVALSDNIANSEGMAVISLPLRTFLEEQKLAQVEYLDVTLVDHKGKPVKEKYFILHPTVVVDCIDTQNSKVTWNANAIDPEMISSIGNLVFKPNSIDPALAIFRPKHKERRLFVRRDLADAIQAKGFTGVMFLEPSEFKG
jgi:hypothetical protein